MNKNNRSEIFRRFKEINPHPTTELEYSSPFELLISVILSAQATDVGVNKATSRLYKIANSPEQIYDLGLDTLKDYIKTIGLFNSKAQNVIKTCKLLIDKHQSQVPNNRIDLEELPGVGRKTANVVLNTAFGQPTMAVDTHIFRVSRRTKLAHGKDVLQIEKSLLRLIPDEYLMDAHHWIILHGRYICKARSPNCKECIIKDLCEYKAKNNSQ
jgi:endonuclease-3